MGQSFAEVQVEDITKITLDPLPHKEIENALVAIGGGGADGANFKLEILKMAGWKGNKLTSYAKDPECATKAFNKVRRILEKTDNPEKIKKVLS